MPISQDRMLDLITAADLIIGAFNRLTNELRAIQDGNLQSIHDAINEIPKTLREELRPILSPILARNDNYTSQLQEYMRNFSFPVEALLTLEREKYHFEKNARRNDKNRIAVRRHRARSRLAGEALDTRDLQYPHEGEGEEPGVVYEDPALPQTSRTPPKYEKYDIMAAYRTGSSRSSFPPPPSRSIPRPSWLKPPESENEE